MEFEIRIIGEHGSFSEGSHHACFYRCGVVPMIDEQSSAAERIVAVAAVAHAGIPKQADAAVFGVEIIQVRVAAGERLDVPALL